MGLTVFVVVLLVMAFAAAVIVRMAWRFFRGDIESEPGGSVGWQLREALGRQRAKKPEDLLRR